MKRKIISTLFALVLVLSFSLVTAVPAAADGPPGGISFEQTGSTTLEWSTTANYTGPYSVQLHAGFAAGDWAEVVLTPPAGITLDDMATITSGWSWWYFIATADFGNRGTQLELHFEGPGDGYAEMTIMDKAYGSQPLGPPTLDAWTEQTIVSNTTTGLVFGTTEAGGAITEYPVGVEGTIADLVTYMIAQETVGDAGAWILTEVRPALGWIGGVQTTAYIDTVTIAGTTYDLEPIVIDAEYYKTDATVGVTVYNGNASGTVAIFATSTTLGTGNPITIALSETGTGTGVFTGSFDLVGTTPATGELLVDDGDSVDVKYTGDWGTGSSQTLDWGDPPSATVDDVAPVITNLAPAASANISDATQTISADYSDADSGTNNSTTVMTLDGLTVTANVTTTSEVIYYPSVNLTDGSHLVTVGISDVAGNPAVTASWSFTVDTVDPVITGRVATPGTVKPDIVNTITFTATVTDGAEGSGINTVTIDLSDSAIGGLDSKAMLDDGNAPDATAGDGIYTANFTGTITTEATYTLTVTATDYVDLTGTADITLIVAEDTTDPVITSPAITYPFVGVESAMPGDTVTISANVTDNVGVTSVVATSTALTGTVTLLDGGVLPDMTVGDHIYTGTGTVAAVASGNYTVTITAKDAKLNAATNVSQTLTVNPAVGGYKIPLAEGWNLISLPLIPDDADITAVISVDTLASANVSSVGIVRGYDPATGDFPRYVPATGSGDLTEMEDGCGYWVFMETADNLTITGRQWPMPPAVPPTYDVVVGWNLIGFKSLVPMIDYEAGPPEVGYLLNIAGTYPVVWSYDAVAGAYFNVKGEALGMEVGHGFWLWVTEVGTIVPPQ